MLNDCVGGTLILQLHPPITAAWSPNDVIKTRWQRVSQGYILFKKFLYRGSGDACCLALFSLWLDIEVCSSRAVFIFTLMNAPKHNLIFYT